MFTDLTPAARGRFNSWCDEKSNIETPDPYVFWRECMTFDEKGLRFDLLHFETKSALPETIRFGAEDCETAAPVLRGHTEEQARAVLLEDLALQTHRILRLAHGQIENPRRWTACAFAANAADRKVAWYGKAAVKWSIKGAVCLHGEHHPLARNNALLYVADAESKTPVSLGDGHGRALAVISEACAAASGAHIDAVAKRTRVERTQKGE